MAKNLIQSPADLSQVLQMLNTNDNDTVHQGEKLLKPFLRNSSCLLPLVQQVVHHADVSIKLQAALLIKRRLPKVYTKISPADKQNLRQQLLQLLVSKQEKVVGTAICGCVASLAKGILTRDKSTMPELFQALTELSHHADDRLRGLTYTLLQQLAENVSKHLVPFTSTLAGMLVMGCQDASSDVAVEAMRAATIYIEKISDNSAVMQMSPVLTPVLNVLGTCLQRGDDTLVLDGLELFEECCDMEHPLINDHIDVLIPFVINIIQADALDYGLKQAASTTFNSLIESRPKLIGKKQLVFPCLEAFVNIIAKSTKSAAGSIFSFMHEDKNLELDDDDEEEDEDMSRIAQTCINVMALNLSSKYFVQPALNICSQCINSPDPQMRKAGCAVLGIITEGCEDAIKPLLPDIVPRLTVLCQDPEILVRECASFAIGQLAEYTQPDILHYANIIMPTILLGLDDQSISVKGTSCYVTEQFVENLEPAVIRPYLNVLVQKLVLLLQNFATAKVSQEIILAAIAATAISAEKEFIPYLEGVVSILSTLMFIENEKLFETRGRALECLGHIAIAVGEEKFQPYFDLGMRSVMQASQIDDETLKEFGYIYIANIARATTFSFASYLPSLIPHLFQVIGESELTEYVDEEDAEEEEEETAKTTLESQGEDDDDDLGDFELNVEEGFVNTKKAAITAIGALAQYTKHLFSPYLEAAVAAILADSKGSFNSLHTSIRAESVDIIRHFVAVVKSATPEIGDYKPMKGVILNMAEGSPIHHIVTVVMNAYIRVIGMDEEKESVANAIEGIVSVLEEIGQAALMVPCTIVYNPSPKSRVMGVTQTGGVVADVIMKQIYELLSEKAPCQKTKESTHHHTELDDDNDHEKLVIDSVADLIAALPKYIGSAFVPCFDEFCKQLMKYAKPNKPYNDRSMVIGIFSEVILELGVESAKYVEMILPAIQQGLADSVEGVRRNSAYCIATIVESHFQSLNQDQILHFLHWLQPVLMITDALQPAVVGHTHITGVVGADIDNALSAVARMIAKVPNLVPLQQVLPVMLKALPLRVDPLEGMTVYGCILSLVTNADANAMSLLPQIIHILAVTLLSEAKSINEDTKKLIVSALKEYAHQSHPVHQYIVNTLQQVQDAAIRNAIEDAMRS